MGQLVQCGEYERGSGDCVSVQIEGKTYRMFSTDGQPIDRTRFYEIDTVERRFLRGRQTSVLADRDVPGAPLQAQVPGTAPNSPGDTFQAFWHGGELNPLAWACLSSFAAAGHTTVLYAYDKIAVPPGVLLKAADPVVSRKDLFVWRGFLQPFSNIFRYRLLLENGGWWIDTDVVCLTGTFPDCDVAFARELDTQEIIASGQIKFPKGHPVMRVLTEEAPAIARTQKVWGQSGPALLTRILQERNQLKRAWSAKTIYPVSWLESCQLWLPERFEDVQDKFRNAISLHLYNGMFERFGIDPWTQPPRGSYLDHLCKRYPFHSPLKPLTSEAYRRTVDLINAYLDQTWVREFAEVHHLDRRPAMHAGAGRYGG